MYKINLYPEYEGRRRAAKKRAAATAALLGLLGIEMLMVGALILSDTLLRDQARTLQAEMPQLTMTLQTASRERPELDLALELLGVRSSRVDWTPMLAAVAENGDRKLVFAEISGEAANKHRTARLSINGEVLGKGEHLEQVSAYLERLRNDERLSAVFDDIALDNIHGDGSGEFDLVCQPAEVK